jgi:hypothetical protein
MAQESATKLDPVCGGLGSVGAALGSFRHPTQAAMSQAASAIVGFVNALPEGPSLWW